MIVWQMIFWLCFTALTYTYVLYPLFMRVLARNKTLDGLKYSREELPAISIIIPAYNEESIIEEKLRSIQTSEIDFSKLEVIICSDNSTDTTNEIVSKWELENDWCKLIAMKERTGKVEVLNQVIPTTKHDLLILSDSNVLFHEELIYNLTRHFKDERIGLVGANFVNHGLKKDGISEQETQYIQSENQLKYDEGVVWGTMMGAFGGCYGIRKALVPIIPKNYLVDDFFITMSVIDQEKKCLNDLEAICYEDVSNELWEEFRRKVRIGTGNWQNLWHYKKWMLKPFSAKYFSFKSHKILRWKGPFYIFILWFLSWYMYDYSFIYKYAFLAQTSLILLALLDFMLKPMNIHIKLIRGMNHFLLMNIALLLGFFRFIGGVRSSIWEPTKRNL